MFPFAFLRVWAIVRRCVAMQRELAGLFLTNGPASSLPSPWAGATAEQILADLNTIADRELGPRAVTYVPLFKHQLEVSEELEAERKIRLDVTRRLVAKYYPSELDKPEPIKWTTPEGADIHEDVRKLGATRYYGPRASYGGPAIIGVVVDPELEELRAIIKPCCGRRGDQPCLYSCLI